MNAALLPLVVAGPFLAAITSMLVRQTVVSRLLLVAVPLAVIAGGVSLVVATADGSVVATQVAGWVPGVAIPFAADTLSALMLTVSGLLVLAGVVFAMTLAMCAVSALFALRKVRRLDPAGVGADALRRGADGDDLGRVDGVGAVGVVSAPLLLSQLSSS